METSFERKGETLKDSRQDSRRIGGRGEGEQNAESIAYPQNTALAHVSKHAEKTECVIRGGKSAQKMPNSDRRKIEGGVVFTMISARKNNVSSQKT